MKDLFNTIAQAVKPTFFHTTPKSPALLEADNLTGLKQAEAVLKIMQRERCATPSEVWRIYGHHVPLTSIRRALTVLKDMGEVVKTEHCKIGLYGKDEHVYRVKQ